MAVRDVCSLPFLSLRFVSQLDALKASEWEDSYLHSHGYGIPLEHLEHRRSATLGHPRHNSLLLLGLCNHPGLPLFADTIGIAGICRGLR